MADKNSGEEDNTELDKHETKTGVTSSSIRPRFVFNLGQNHDDDDDVPNTSSATEGPPPPKRGRRLIRPFRRQSLRTRPSLPGMSDSDGEEGDDDETIEEKVIRYHFFGAHRRIKELQEERKDECEEKSQADISCDRMGKTKQEEEEQIQRRFDWLWDKESKSQASHVTSNEQQVDFHLEYSCGTAACRGSMEMSEGQHYWEINMVSSVYGTDMMIGIGTKEMNFGDYAQTFCSLLGNDNNGESCGLSYTGAFHFAGRNNWFCKFGTGDVIGVHLDMWYGTLSFYKNGFFIGIAKTGLTGKAWYPVVCSTAARSCMKLVRASSYSSTLQFLCCCVLRKHVPPECNVITSLAFPPGLKTYLNDQLGWLLKRKHSVGNVPSHNKATQTLLTMMDETESDEV